LGNAMEEPGIYAWRIAKRSLMLLKTMILLYRAYDYKVNLDPGGIAYLNRQLKRGDTALDIGAHKGAYLYFMRKRVGKKGKVIAFEPQPVLYAYLCQLKRMFRWRQLLVEPLALSNGTGTASFYVPENQYHNSTSPGASLIRPKDPLVHMITTQVSTESLDSYCAKYQVQPHFLKIDVEGNELNLFKGGIATLKQYKPKILVEIEARHVGEQGVQDTFNFLSELGYQGAFIQGKHILPLSSFCLKEHQNLNNKLNYCNNFIFE
jgi:FkbM family methyltransferase